jgi:hypothetical protein
MGAPAADLGARTLRRPRSARAARIRRSLLLATYRDTVTPAGGALRGAGSAVASRRRVSPSGESLGGSSP